MANNVKNDVAFLGASIDLFRYFHLLMSECILDKSKLIVLCEDKQVFSGPILTALMALLAQFQGVGHVPICPNRIDFLVPIFHATIMKWCQ